MSDFEFGEPARLLWLWAVAPFAVLLVLAARRARAAREALMSSAAFSRLAVSRTPGAEIVRGSLLVIGLALLIAALAKPRFGFRLEEVKRRGADLVIAIDVSRSMLSRDVPPSRLDRAKTYVKDLLAATRGDRVALVAFAGKAVPMCPLTVDHGFFVSALEELSPDSAPRGGTAIGDAIRAGVDLLERNPERDAAIVLITDGEDHESFPLEAAAVARERGVKIFTVGIGDPSEGAKVPGKDASVMSFDGKEVVSKMDEELLTKIALETSGAYVPARTGTYNLGQVYTDHLENLRAAELSTEKRRRFVEQFQWFAAAGLVLLALSRVVDSTRRRTVVIAAFLLGCSFVAAPRASAAESTLTRTQAQAVNAAIDVLEAGRPAEAIPLLDAVIEPQGADGVDAVLEEPSIALVRGSARLALGERDEAKKAFERAADGSDPNTTLRARYNLGSIESAAAKELLGEHPEAAEGETRTNALAALDRARDHFRAALQLDADHADARHNLELLRLYVKSLKDAWRKADEAKKEQEKQDEPWLDQLERLGKDHESVLAEAVVASTPESLTALAVRERAIAEELPLVVDKLKTQFDAPPPPTPGGPPPQEKSEEQKQAEVKLLEAIAAIQERSESLASELEAPTPNVESLSEGLAFVDDGLAGSFLLLAPYERILKRGIGWQESYVKVAKGEANLAPNHQARQQSRLGPLAELLVEHAKRELPQLQQTPPPTLPEGLDEKQRAEAEKQLEKQKAALEGRIESMKRAIEKAPSIPPLAADAATAFGKAEPATALPHAEAIEKILKEIAEPLQSDDQDQDGDSKQDDSEKDEKKDESKPEESKPQDSQQESKPDESKAEPKPQELTQEQIEELLKQAMDREKEFEKKKRELLKGLAVPVKVEKDW